MPFDEVPVKREISNELWPEQYLVEFVQYDTAKNEWKIFNDGGPVNGETWLGRNKQAHTEVKTACAAYHTAKGNKIEIKRVCYC